MTTPPGQSAPALPAPSGDVTVGLLLMGAALAVDHGVEEAVLTIGGVLLLAGAHILNLRHTH